MPLIDPLPEDQAPLLARPFYAGGDPGPIAGTLARVPELMEVTLPFVSVALGASSIPFRTKEIVIVRTSALLACRYCVDTHTPVALDAGLTPEEVRALRCEPGTSVDETFADDREQALVRWVDHVAAGRGPVPVADTEAVRAAYADHGLVELTVLVGATMLLNRYATTLQLPVSAGTLARLAAEGFAA